MTQYKIYTERKNLRWMTTMISEYFGGFTIYKTLGFCQSKPEKSVCIEIITDEVAARHKVGQIILKIRGYNKQGSVLVVETAVNNDTGFYI